MGYNKTLDFNIIRVNYLPYKKKPYFFSVPEMKFYNLLKSIIGDNYYIYPKVRICDIIERVDRKSYADFNRIKSKHVDFLICNKEPITSKIIIELDDQTHNLPERKARDKFIDEVFGNAGIPIVHIKTQYSYNKDIVTSQILDAYKTKFEISEEVKNNSVGCGGLTALFVLAIVSLLL